PPITDDCAASGTYTANDSGFTNPANTWLWSIEPPVVGVNLTDATLVTCTVSTDASAVDVEFNLKVVATDSVSTDTANRTTTFDQDRIDTNVAPEYIGPNVQNQPVTQGIPIPEPIETFGLFTGTNLVFSLEGGFPADLVIDAGPNTPNAGQITGTPTDPLGPYPNLDVRATNSKGSAASNLFDIEVVASEIAPVFIPPIPDQIVQVGVPIVQFALAGYFTGTPSTYTIDSGAFPTGLTMNTAGQVNGT
ncbi:unnamed protein product, partial [marine sediment metagenome]